MLARAWIAMFRIKPIWAESSTAISAMISTIMPHGDHSGDRTFSGLRGAGLVRSDIG